MSRADVSFVAAAAIKGRRFVTIDKTAGTVDYTAAGAVPDGITLADYAINCRAHIRMVGANTDMPDVEMEGIIVRGVEITVGTNGKGVTFNITGTGFYAAEASVANQIIEAYEAV